MKKQNILIALSVFSLLACSDAIAQRRGARRGSSGGGSLARKTSASRPHVSRSGGSQLPGNVRFPSRPSGSGTPPNGSRSVPSRIGNSKAGLAKRPGLGSNSADRRLPEKVSNAADNRIDRNRTPGQRLPGTSDRRPNGLRQEGLIPGLSSDRADRSRIDEGLRDQLSNRRTELQSNRGDRRDQRFENREEMVAERRDWMDQRMEDRQQFRNDAREDWQDWADDQRWGYGWHHGYWHGGFDDYWRYMWDTYPVYASLRVTTWGVNRARYLFGWGYYYNPYYIPVVGVASPVYTQPLVSNITIEQYITTDSSGNADSASGTEQDSPPPAAQSAFEDARSQFEQRDYEAALASIDASIKQLPKDTTLHEFRSLTLFALGRYEEAAASIHAVLAVGPGWDWTTLSQFYNDHDDYTAQLRKLESVARKSGTAPQRFLLAYHYMTCGHTDAAIEQLQAVVKLQPEDSVAQELLEMMGGAKPEPAVPPSQSEPVQESSVVGTWNARREDDTTFEMQLKKNGEFIWTYRHESESETVRGVFALKDNVLAMQLDSGGMMAADISLNDGLLAFRQLGDSQPPVQFTRKP